VHGILEEKPLQMGEISIGSGRENGKVSVIFPEEFEDKTRVLAIEVAGGFVREQHGGTIGQAAGLRYRK
jgi:hypothetical protein